MLIKLSTTIFVLGILASIAQSHEQNNYYYGIPQCNPYWCDSTIDTANCHDNIDNSINTVKHYDNIDNYLLSHNKAVMPNLYGNIVFTFNTTEKVSNLTKLLNNLYSELQRNNDTVEKRNNYVKQFWNTISEREYDSLGLLLKNSSTNTLKAINTLLNIPEIRRYNALSNSQYWKRYIAGSLSTIKDQCIDGTNIQVNYSMSKKQAETKFSKDYHEFFDKYSKDYNVAFAQYEFEQEGYDNKIKFNTMLYNLSNSSNYDNAKLIIYNLCNIFEENMPMRLINEVKQDWQDAFEKAWKIQNQDKN